jgi:hypothetical protein
MRKYKTKKLIQMQEFSTILYSQVHDSSIGITPGVLKNILKILAQDKLAQLEGLLDLIDEARWEDKTLWEAYGAGGLWEGTAERLESLLRESSVSKQIAWALAGRGLHILLGQLLRLESGRLKYHHTNKERRWIIAESSKDVITVITALGQ